MKTLLWLCPETATADPAAVRDRYLQLTRIAQSAAASGFAGFAASEHHWRTDGYCPDAMGLLTGIGAVVHPHILMSAIIPLPFWDPRILAERAAVATAVSGAEVWLGIGTGCDPHELKTAGWTKDELGSRTEMLIEQLKAFVAQGLAGIFGPPRLLLGAMTAAGARRAARTGLGWISDPRATTAELAELARTYRENGGTGPVVIMRDACLGGGETEWLERALADHRRFWATPRQGLRGRGSPGVDAIESDVLLHGDAHAVGAAMQQLRTALDPDLLCLRIELPNWQEERQTVSQLDRWRRLLTSLAVEQETA